MEGKFRIQRDGRITKGGMKMTQALLEPVVSLPMGESKKNEGGWPADSIDDG